MYIIPNTSDHDGNSYSEPHFFNTHVIPNDFDKDPGQARDYILDLDYTTNLGHTYAWVCRCVLENSFVHITLAQTGQRILIIW